jgi:intracellular sulfur oxidation DsrE/DsrF family protein
MELLAMRRLLLAFLLLLPFAAAAGETQLAEPKPSIDNPRRIVVSLAEADPARINAVLSNIGNIQKFYGADNVRLALVAYGPGLAALLADSPVKARIESLRAIEVEMVACGATMAAMHKTEKDLLDGVETVENALPEIVERQLQGWVHLRP